MGRPRDGILQALHLTIVRGVLSASGILFLNTARLRIGSTTSFGLPGGRALVRLISAVAMKACGLLTKIVRARTYGAYGTGMTSDIPGYWAGRDSLSSQTGWVGRLATP